MKEHYLITEAKSLFEKHDLVSSLETISAYIVNDKSSAEALLLRARIHYKMQHWGDAMNDYYEVLEIDPQNMEAKTGVEMARNILGYFTPDMFNP